MALPILLKHLCTASVDLPICDSVTALEFYQRMLDVMVSPRGADE